MTNTTKENPTYKMVGDDLVLFADTELDKNLIIKGNIYCESGIHSLFVYGSIVSKHIDVLDITADNIFSYNINAFNIDAKNINAFNIDANNIDALDIYAGDIWANVIICEKRLKAIPEAKTIAAILTENRSSLKRREQMPTTY